MSFRRSIESHGLAALPPGRVDIDGPCYHLTVAFASRIATIAFTECDGALRFSLPGRAREAEWKLAERIARRIFRLDDDLAPFYAMIAGDPNLAWARSGAGRMLASPRVFDDLIRTICTTNCAWSATTRMIEALVRLGDGAFPDPEKLARTPERWFAEVARMGYRGPYVRAIARDVSSGRLDVERFVPAHGMGEDAVEAALLELPGVGPYAAAHMLQLLGYYRRLILDSWTRPKFLRLSGMKRATDRTIRGRFARYGPYAGLAFWLYLTRDWHEQSKE